MGSIDYVKLYSLQDKVLDIIFNIGSIFYLTGGTCLSRFYQEKRYSDDLDLFTHINNDFSREIKEIRNALDKKFKITNEVSSKDFIRFKIDDILQVDFINDRVMRYEKTIHLDNGYIIDNCKNILSNKITAIMGRDNPKDIFDIYLIDKCYSYCWNEILGVAHTKNDFNNNDLIIRLKTFPVFLLTSISLKDSKFLDNFENEYGIMIEKIEHSIEKNGQN